MAKQYSNEEIEFLKENAPKFGAQICAEKLNRKVDSVRYKLSRLGICSKKDKSLTKKERKTIKRTINILKSHKMEDDDEIESNMNDIINNPYCVKEYLDMVDSFHAAIENDDIHLEKG